MKKIGVVGSGYVGLATALTFGHYGHEIICGDIDPQKVEMINRGSSPVNEDGYGAKLSQLVTEGRLTATTDIKKLTENSEIIFICVDTPMLADGTMGTEALENAAISISEELDGQLIVIKSTTVPGTTRDLIKNILEQNSDDFGLCHNPEFLREGNALHDSLNPDRIIIGAENEEDGKRLLALYTDFNCPKLVTNLETSEMIKYASNIFLAAKITYANEMANICEKFGVDVYEVMDGVKLDKRISPEFLEAGAGFGGSCFPKDLNAIIKASEQAGYTPKMIKSVMETNDEQPLRTVELLESVISQIENKNIAILGLAFKENSDDIRNSRAIPIVKALIERGANLTLYDPLAIDDFKALGFEKLNYTDDLETALKDKDAAIIQTKWPDITNLEPQTIKDWMRTPIIIDGRRTFDPKTMLDNGITYLGIGWKNRVDF